MIRVIAAAVLAAVLAVLPWPLGTPAAVAAAAGASGPVVLVGVPGLRWSDLDPNRTPNLWRLAASGAIGSLSVRSVNPRTCPTDGWLTISAGERAALAHGSCGLPPPPVHRGDGAVVEDFAALRRENATSKYGAVVGLLGEAVRRSGGCVTAVGPGAALAGADTSGRVARYAAAPATLPAADWARCPVTVVDIDTVVRAYVDAGVDSQGEQVPVTAAQRALAVRLADDAVGRVVAAIPSGATLLVVGASDTDPIPHLRVAIAWRPAGGAFAGGYLTASSTRRAGLVTLTDVTATVLATAGVPLPSQAVGSPWRTSPARPATTAAAVAALTAQDAAAQATRRLLPPFFVVLVVGQLGLYAAAAVALRRRWAGPARRRVLALTQVVALAGAAVPVATFLAGLVPWWRWPHPAAGVVAAVVVADVLVVGFALAGPWRRSLLGAGTAVAAVTAVVIALDLMSGSRLQLNSLMGYSPLVAGRFYGIGNVGFAVFATAVLLAAAGLAQWLVERGVRPGWAGTAVAAVGLVAAAIDGAPAFGADFGGVLALVPGVAVTALLVAGRRITPWRVATMVGAGALAVLAVAFADHLRPPGTQTHLGRFFGQLVSGEAGRVVVRKLLAMLHTLGNPTLTPIVVAALAFLVLVLQRPAQARLAALDLAYARAPLLRAGLAGVWVCAAIGFVVNDSGVAVPALALTVAVPSALAASARALQQPDPGPAAPRGRPAQAARP